MTLADLRGRPVILNFTNSQCGPCLDELPALQWAATTFKGQGVRVVSVATSADTLAGAGRLAAAVHLPYPVLFDNQAVSWQYDVAELPTTIFLDANGRLRGQQVGPLDKQTVRDGLAQAGAITCGSCSPVESLGPLAAGGSGRDLAADFVFNPPERAPYFALTDQNGKTVTPASLRGKVVLMTFLSSVCREQCPLIGVTVRLVRRQLGLDASRLSVVVVSVDPEQDSAANTRAFAQEAGWQGTDWHYLTAPRKVLAPIWSAYGIYVPEPSPIFKPGQSIVHQAGIYLLDPTGSKRGYFNVPVMASRVASAARALMPS
jgi:cytochrome oxidase Cu insertion factor (SCO1/SenC/PrrC family)